MSREQSKPTDIKEIAGSCSQVLTEVMKLYPEFGINTLSIDLMADCQEPIRAKAYQFTDLNICIDDLEPNQVVLEMQTTARLQAQALFSKESGELVYTGLQILNDQKKPAAWEKPTSPVGEVRIIEASTLALKQLQG